MTRYTSLNEYCQKTFGGKVYRISLDAGLSCPNRDGTLGTGGCIFCSRGGSGDFAEKGTSPAMDPADWKASILSQLEEGKKRILKKTPYCRMYIAYFQSYTNTYGPISYLRDIFTAAISHPEVAVLSIATRPDCLGEDVLNLLEELNRRKPVWVELGLQTIHEKTALLIERGYSLPVYDRAVYELHKRGIKVVTHVILGLPGEDEEAMTATVDHVVQAGSDGIKLQLLHILKGTKLGEMYEAGRIGFGSFPKDAVEKAPLSPVPDNRMSRNRKALDSNISVIPEGKNVPSPKQYYLLLKKLLKRIPKDMIVHRLTGDGPKALLIEPKWTADKKRVLNDLNRFLSDEPGRTERRKNKDHDLSEGKNAGRI